MMFVEDGSGSISTKELVGVMRSIGQNPTEDEILALVLEADTNGDGTIDFEVYLTYKNTQQERMKCGLKFI